MTVSNDLTGNDGMYMYCVVEGAAEDLYLTGINEEKVIPLVYREITAVAHRCKLNPYCSGEDEVVKGWVKDHHRVVEEYWMRYGNVMPFTFNTIIKSAESEAPEDLLLKWLEDNYRYIQGKLRFVEGCGEYGVQVVMDTKKAAEKLMDSNEEIELLREELSKSTKGKGFLIKEKINARLKALIEAEADKVFGECHSSIVGMVKKVSVEKTRKQERNKILLLNLNCLADENQCARLGMFLDRVNGVPYLEVIFSGPWPPYSFM